MSVSHVDVSEHYEWGEGCHGWRLAKSDGLSVIQELVPPAVGEVRHYHSRSEQYFYVIKGKAMLEVSGAQHELGEQQGCYVKPGEAHQLRNEGQEDLDFLVISSPPSHADRIQVDGAPR